MPNNGNYKEIEHRPLKIEGIIKSYAKYLITCTTLDEIVQARHW